MLDLFAGTGSLGIEALSRGAPRAVFVERDRNALTALRHNLRELGAAGRSTVIGADVRTGLRRLAASLGKEDRFSWVFMDPPYADETESILAELSEKSLLTGCAVVIVEHDRHHLPPERVGALEMVDRRLYGDTGVSFYRCQWELA